MCPLAGPRRSCHTRAFALAATAKAVCTLPQGLVLAVSVLSAGSVSPAIILARNAASILGLFGSISKSTQSIVKQPCPSVEATSSHSNLGMTP